MKISIENTQIGPRASYLEVFLVVGLGEADIKIKI